MTPLTHFTLLCPEGAAAQSPGLPLRLPWELKERVSQRKAVASIQQDLKRSQPRCGCDVTDCFLSPG